MMHLGYLKPERELRQPMIYLHLIAWLPLIITTSIGLAMGSFGPAGSWCWIVNDDMILRVLTYSLVWVAVGVSVVFTTIMIVRIRKNTGTINNAGRVHRKNKFATNFFLVQALLYVCLVIFCFFWPTLDRLYDAIIGHQSPILMFLHALIGPLWGFLNILAHLGPKIWMRKVSLRHGFSHNAHKNEKLLRKQGRHLVYSMDERGNYTAQLIPDSQIVLTSSSSIVPTGMLDEKIMEGNPSNCSEKSSKSAVSKILDNVRARGKSLLSGTGKGISVGSDRTVHDISEVHSEATIHAGDTITSGKPYDDEDDEDEEPGLMDLDSICSEIERKSFSAGEGSSGLIVLFDERDCGDWLDMPCTSEGDRRSYSGIQEDISMVTVLRMPGNSRDDDAEGSAGGKGKEAQH
eukprot:CFRG5793T1